MWADLLFSIHRNLLANDCTTVAQTLCTVGTLNVMSSILKQLFCVHLYKENKTTPNVDMLQRFRHLHLSVYLQASIQDTAVFLEDFSFDSDAHSKALSAFWDVTHTDKSTQGLQKSHVLCRSKGWIERVWYFKWCQSSLTFQLLYSQ